MRKIVLDTETTGLDPAQGHRIIEIGCVELINRRPTDNKYHQYINPQREIDAGAIEIHGITNEMLADKPNFAEIANDFLDYIKGGELIIHNAPFDVGFLNSELALYQPEQSEEIATHCSVVDTLKLARKMHPGQKNDLDSLCKRYEIDNTQRTLHGALLDAEILADVYLAMTGGQSGLFDDGHDPAQDNGSRTPAIRRLAADRPKLPVIAPTPEEMAAHLECIATLDNNEEREDCLWTRLELG